MNKMAEQKMATLWRIGWSFCKISPLSFGGGYAMIPMIEKEIVDRRRWMDAEELSDVLSIAGSAPGGIAVNAAALTGFRLAGIQGLLAAVLGIALPNFVVILLLALGYALVSDGTKAMAALAGIHSAVVAFIAVAGFRMWKSTRHDTVTSLLIIGALAALLFSPIHPALLLLVGTLTGLLLFKWKEKLSGRASAGETKHNNVPGADAAAGGQFIWGDGI
ncbi:chromate transporter [Paenibacillus xerothermodurans]|uniref:Chromate transporter n=1 Tax=Paenibacillus xerothermodurans TaxID=1977292 RepID=A0A2W1NLM3_PAEXE|nr:chromate transporter [Paenibacillus xerothermodurans]PZE20335.1 chromate transporter [Paenibacillus xerothermodurans]